ncbi:FAD linked oxidase domain protein [Cellulomonas flavigena DSM 20109]|uniref:FAD linked oxidase domain protein n=1 Tax=Cellulomonas flavigena (strain ATCC 482 / DSM 20109 / BCRC 11376 / JCM 18109 / NBRC 3775 / NCIMB 8073 / NRS 134) TaxID=446466 RepID=D5UHN7_CELFN|nr:FAD-binding protein [Cellulomonas flavigena]ADG73311.1 FAD linked oxidase domain protein [Cellulomonas flavigena DSM 20109]
MTLSTSSDTLAATLRGRLLLPGSVAFDQAATPWNLAVRQPAAAVVEAADADDVVTLVRHARAEGLAVAAQSTGHGATGDVAGTVLLRTGRLDAVTVDPAAGTARVGAGATWAAVQARTAPHGLTGLLGSAPGVGVTGYTLGGGLGWFSRVHGLAAHRVRSFDVVGADGEPGTVTATSDPDLFWALRGGGGDLAIVTALEIDLVEVPALTGGGVVWPADRAGAVLDAFREVTASAPRELSVWLTRVEPPGAPAMVVVRAAYLGDDVAARTLLRPFDAVGGALTGEVRPVALADVGSITADRPDPTAGLSHAELLTGVDDDALTRLLTSPVGPVTVVQLRHLGGALAEADPDDGATGAITEPYLLYALGLAHAPGLAAAVRARLDRLPDDLAHLATGRRPATFLSPGERASAAYSPDALARLQGLKRSRDPHGTIRGAYPLIA